MSGYAALGHLGYLFAGDRIDDAQTVVTFICY
jgi:hypothetical protein